MAQKVKGTPRPGEQDPARVVDDLQLQAVCAPVDTLEFERRRLALHARENPIQQKPQPMPLLQRGMNPSLHCQPTGIAAHR